jgi:hypothetical protein
MMMPSPVKAITNSSLLKLSLIINLVMSSFVFVGSAYTQEKTINSLVIKPYDLEYVVDIGGMKVKASHQLLKQGTQYRVKTTAKNFLGTIREQGDFEVSKTGKIVPLKYTEQQKMMMGNRSESQNFDWSSKSLSYSVDGSSGEMDILPGYFDRLSLTEQLRIDIASGSKKIVYTIIRKGKKKQYQYQVIGNQILKTDQGSYNSLVIERLSGNSAKKTKIWFAVDWDYAILKLETYEKNSKKTMVLNQGKLNGNSILPL